MNARALIAAAIAAAALAGCTYAVKEHPMSGHAMNGKQKTAVCNAGICKVQVWVDCHDGNCTIETDSVFLAVASGTRPNIEWDLVKKQGDPQPSPDFKFAANGIDFGNEASSEFSGCGPQGNGRKYTCKDNQTNRSGATTVWKYTIKVEAESGATAVAPYDPWVINN